jgi:hypothetical protein
MDHGEICRIRGHLPAEKQAANGVFIAEAPNDIAELLGEVRWLRERLREQGLTETD